MKEVKLKRCAGPFKKIPFNNYIQSPVGLVEKDHRCDMHLIFHLSYAHNGTSSVNYNTPNHLSRVKYVDFDEAIRLCLLQLQESEICFLVKSNAESTFHILGLNPSSWQWLILKARSPLDGQVYYFVDKCLPFGSSISCALFQEVSDALAFLVKFQTKKPLVNYLDDFLFVATLHIMCNLQLEQFLAICKEINFPVSKRKDTFCMY